MSCGICRSDMWQWKQEEECCLPIYSQFALPLWDDTMGNQTPLRGFGDFDLDELDFGDEVEKGVEEANEASRVKRRRVLNFFSDDDGATAVNEHLSSEVVREDSTSAKICTQNLQSNLTCSDDRFLFSNEVLDPSSDEWMENYFNDSEIYIVVGVLSQSQAVNPF
ncbi:uncharacterized protein LOC122001673 isoform X2 [Zingiber officinale]|uniref:uncharacterized protein LOC122001673 isoform X2 n=1 Tax=Zingiber officinale TaxID=94328 RepID=UPI001C4B28D4|nr:uncharacterized protein LOC122001673 isoform X2 [Zingiber officinale]